jgi:hypothetical protein
VLSEAAATRGLAISAGAATGAPPASFSGLAALRRAPGASDVAGASSSSATARNGNSDGPIGSNGEGTTLVELDPFSAPYIEQDWARWNSAFAALQTEWFEPALAALQSGELAQLVLTLCGDTGSVTLNVTRADLRKFWRRRVLASLFIE